MMDDCRKAKKHEISAFEEVEKSSFDICSMFALGTLKGAHSDTKTIVS